MTYLGECLRRSRRPRVGNGEKSAEAILAVCNEPRIDTVEDSQHSEGLNIGLSRIR